MEIRMRFLISRSKTWHIFEENYRDLCEAREQFNNPRYTYEHNGAIHTTHLNPHDLQQKIERRFHNFLAASKTLVDHTRVLMNEYGKFDADKEFELKIKVMQISPVVKFCHDLRNYFFTRQTPLTTCFCPEHGMKMKITSYMGLSDFRCILVRLLLISSCATGTCKTLYDDC